MKLLSYF